MSPAIRTFFSSRWVTAPAAAQELDSAQLAPGFRAGGIACGLKDGGATDVGVLACDEPEVRSALALTRNAAAAAPVRVCRDDCEAGAIRAVAVNSGNANAATGEQGYRDALAMRDAAAEALNVEPQDRGGGGDRHDRRPARHRGSDDGRAGGGRGPLPRPAGTTSREAIMTTDKGPEAVHGPGRRGDRLRPGKGRRDDRAGLRHDALLRPDRRRCRRPRRGPALGAGRLDGADHGRRPDEHQRHGAAPGDRHRRRAAARGAARRRAAAARTRDRRRRGGRDQGRTGRGHRRGR